MHLPIIRLRLSIIMLNMADSSSARFSFTVSLTTPFFMSIIIERAETIWKKSSHCVLYCSQFRLSLKGLSFYSSSRNSFSISKLRGVTVTIATWDHTRGCGDGFPYSQSLPFLFPFPFLFQFPHYSRKLIPMPFHSHFTPNHLRIKTVQNW